MRRWIGKHAAFGCFGCFGLLALACACDRPAAESGPIVIRVVGEEFEWHVRYPGPDRMLDTSDDVIALRDLHIPVDSNIEIELDSSDYIYQFQIPDLGVNQMAVPNVAFKARLKATQVGSLPLLGDQMCGYAHESLLGQVIVHTSSGFEEWQARQETITR
jgi:cytochrome c oxidase subunit 2